MAKAETGKPKPSGKKKTPAKDEKPQSERFIETARALGVDESGKKFEKALQTIIPAKYPSRSQQSD